MKVWGFISVESLHKICFNGTSSRNLIRAGPRKNRKRSTRDRKY
jgi:hypothetical protein